MDSFTEREVRDKPRIYLLKHIPERGICKENSKLRLWIVYLRNIKAAETEEARRRIKRGQRSNEDQMAVGPLGHPVNPVFYFDGQEKHWHQSEDRIWLV